MFSEEFTIGGDMSPKEGEEPIASEAKLLRWARRGARIKLIREARGETGPEFGAELARRLAALGVPMNYDGAKISKLERGGRDVTPEEATVILSMDPEERTMGWFVFGDVSRKMNTRVWTRAG